MDTISDHAAQAIDRLPELFKAKPNLTNLLTVWCAPIQEFENVLYALLIQRTVDVAIGAQLDQLGVIVDQDRNGLTDDDYRRYIRAAIRANLSDGTINDLLVISRLIVNDPTAVITFVPGYPGSGVISVTEIPFEDAIATALAVFLRKAATAGVRIVLEYNVDTAARFDIDHFDTVGDTFGVAI
jgi:hypothetical protein